MSDHFYDRQANPHHEVNGKSTTLAHARKNSWVPSSTTVLKVYPKPGLNFFIGNSQIDAASENPYNNNGKMTRYQWRGMIRDAAAQKGKDAAELGSLYHDTIEALINDYELPHDAGIIPADFFPAFREWWDSSGYTVLETECSFVHHLGYGGRIDLIAEDQDGVITYVDWKTQDTKEDKPVNFYDGWELQLESYARGDQDYMGADYPEYNIVSVVVSRTEPGRIESKQWHNNDRYWEVFKSCLDIWKYQKKYDSGWEE